MPPLTPKARVWEFFFACEIFKSAQLARSDDPLMSKIQILDYQNLLNLGFTQFLLYDTILSSYQDRGKPRDFLHSIRYGANGSGRNLNNAYW